MKRERLTGAEIAKLLRDEPEDLCDLAMELRKFVLSVAPQLSETIAFHALCYYKSGQPYGVIGGNVCLIAPRDDCLHLAFIHGASLPDPEGLLMGNAKAKRFIRLRSMRDIQPRAVRKLLRSAIEFNPKDREG